MGKCRRKHAHTPPGFVNGPHSDITAAALQSPRGEDGMRRGCLGLTHPAETLAPKLRGRSIARGTLEHSQEECETSRPGPNYPWWKGNGEWKTRVPDLQSAADLGQSPPCSSLSFPINRPGLTVSIATLAPFGWPSPELEGTPSSSRSPFFRPACEVACRNPSLQQRVIGVPGWREGWTRGGCHRARAAIWQ